MMRVSFMRAVRMRFGLEQMGVCFQGVMRGTMMIARFMEFGRFLVMMSGLF